MEHRLSVAHTAFRPTPLFTSSWIRLLQNKAHCEHWNTRILPGLNSISQINSSALRNITTPQSHYLLCCKREFYVEVWYPAVSKPLVLQHRLTRTGRDFRALAANLSPHYHLFIPDTLRRGRSQWAQDPMTEYTVPFYVKQAVALLEHFRIKCCG